MSDRIDKLRASIREMLDAPNAERTEPLEVPLAVVKFTRGATGRDGINGIDGSNGRDGVDGRDGTRGDRGESGERGLSGDTGAKGLDGSNGLDGRDGEAGLVWRGTFVEGETYDVGDIVGLDGSAFVAVDRTSQAPPVGFGWELLAARGERGASGNRGVDGATGSNGADGADGANGNGLAGYRPDAAAWTLISNAIPKYSATNISTFNAGGNTGSDAGIYLVSYCMIYLTRETTINKLLVYCGTGGGTGNVTLGIYTSDPMSGLPTTRVYTSASIVFTGTAGTAISATGVATTLSAGFHYLAAVFDSFSNVYTLNVQILNAFGHPTPTNVSPSRGIYTNALFTYELPSDPSSGGELTIDRAALGSTIAAVFFEVAS